MVDAKGLNVTAEYIKGLTTKRAEIKEVIGYKDFSKEDEPSKEKLVMNVELETQEIMEYIPNKTAFKTLCKLFGSKNLEINWKGKLIQFYTAPTMYQGKKTEVLYIDDVDINKIVEVKI